MKTTTGIDPEFIELIASRDDETRSIQQMSEAELEPYRIIETKNDLHLVPKDQTGTPIEEIMSGSSLSQNLRGAMVYVDRRGDEIIIQSEDDERT